MRDDGIAGILLGAGGATRFGGDKLSADLCGRPVLQHSVDAMLEAGLHPVVVVVRPDVGWDLGDSVVVVVNQQWRTGIASSIRAGFRALGSESEALAAVVAPADQPRCGAAVYRRLLDTWLSLGASEAGTRPVVAAFDGALRNPVLLPRELWSLVDTLHGDAGLSQVIRGSSSVTVECSEVGSVADIDTPQDLDRIRRDWDGQP